MLTRRDFRWNFLLWKVLSSIMILQVDIDQKRGILKKSQSPWRRWISHGFFGLSIIHGCYIHFRLLQVMLDSQEIPRHHLAFHVDLSLVSPLIQGWYLACFILYPDTFVAVFNDVFATTEGHGDSSAESRASLKTCSRQEWLVLTLPTNAVLAIGFILWIFTYDRSMAFLLYSAVPQNYKSPFWFRVLFCEEIRSVAFLGSTASVVLIAQLLFFEKVISSLKTMKSSILNTSMHSEAMVEQAFNQLRIIQLKVSLFNNINRFITFSFKFMCISLGTLNGYFMIAYFSSDPVFGCFYCIAFGFLCISYSVMYERAYAIPAMVGQTKSIVPPSVGIGVRAPGLKRKIEMRLRSVPDMGIQVGRFHTFERVATPVFMDFVIRNVMGLLVMHLKK